jgi:hypothetical protein
MARFDGSPARRLDFGEMPPVSRVPRVGLRLAVRPGRLAGPDKYKILDHRRRQAQIRARRLLDLL